MSAEAADTQKKFEYGRDLYVALFKDDAPFVNLGFAPRQKGLARRVLSQLEGPGTVVLSPYPCAYFTETDPLNPTDTQDAVYMRFLRHSGYNIHADIPTPSYYKADPLSAVWPPEPLYDSFDAYRSALQEMTFFEGDDPGVVAVVNMLPWTTDYSDVNQLVKHLYEGTEISNNIITAEPQTLASRLKSPFSPKTATFRAAWVDDQTKLDLVVESDFMDRVFDTKKPEKYIDIWRRLPELDQDGQIWIPFGKKPNSSNKNAKLAFEAKGKRVVTGNLATETSQIAA